MEGGSQKEKRRSKALERVSDGVVSLNADLEYTYINPRAEQLLDTTEETVLGEYIWDAFPKGQNSIAETKLQEATETGQQQIFERYNEEIDRWFEVRIYPDEDGYSIIFTDISERKDREQELQKYEQVIESLPVTVGINTLGEDGRFDFINQAAVEMFNAESKSAFQELSPSDLYANSDEWEQFIDQLQHSGSVEQYEAQFTTFQEETFWGSATAEVIEIEDEKYVIGIIEDISARKDREQELEYKT
ncbi:PAS domain-containing protein [Halovenus rubra]|uniref:PAS domain-containing protein n=2 Tax=Halovenus rubra TaxID=869890 RepID=A0ACC7E424_9EURY|nr:GGDEF and EAL domain-containing protein [Halovenus rubra]